MRLWSLHPKYLDPKGLVALWREALLAQAVLRGATRGYRRHPQLERFRAQASPTWASSPNTFARCTRNRSERGYRFDAGRIAPDRAVGRIDVTRGQVAFEWGHLRRKLETRAPEWRNAALAADTPLPHPLFRAVPGGVAGWERTAP